MIRVPPKADPDTAAAFKDVEQRLRDLESAKDTASAAELSIVRDDLIRLRGELRRVLGDLSLNASQVNYLPPSTAHTYNVQKALEELEFRTATPYDTAPEYFWPFPGCWMSNSANFTHNSTGNFLQLTLDTINEDNNSMGDTANNRLVAKTAGIYHLVGHVHFASNTTGTRWGAIKVNGVVVVQSSTPGSGNSSIISFGRYNRLAKGDLVTLWGFQDSGGNLTMGNQYFLGAQWVRL